MTQLISNSMTRQQELLPECGGTNETGAFTTSRPEFASAYADVLGVNVSAINMDLAVQMMDRWIAAGNPGYACLAAVHGVMEAQSDLKFRRILNRAVLNAPDGMPLTWVGRLQGHRRMDRVYGPDFMMAMCQLSAERGYRNFLFGGNPGVAELLRDSLRRIFPSLQVVGTFTPPFRSLNLDEETELIAQVHQAKPHILWVGLGTPKQERFMAQFFERLQVPLLVGVGAAFDFHTGRLRDCPRFIKRAGLQWLHRLIQEPRRLWKRYILTNPAFLWHIAWQLSGLRQYPGEQR